jgi:serine/threonine-protein phosphatase PGAM5
MRSRLLYLVRHGDYDGDGELTELGREQARRTGERLAGVSITAIHHSTEARAAQTADVIAASLPGVPVHPSELLVECIPALPERAALTDSQAEFFASLPADAVAQGPGQAAAAVERYAGLGDGGPELLVSHGNLINWFVSQALGGPDFAWLRMLDYHCAITAILYLEGRVKLASYNDMGHLPPEMRGTDYPIELRI